MLVDAEKIGQVMNLSPLPHTLAELEKAVYEGLPKSAIKASIDHILLSPEDRKKLLFHIIPEATYKRRLDKLSVKESERTERLARVFATAEFVWNSAEDARSFLVKAHPILKNRTPLEMVMSELGARQVELLLWKLCYRLPL